MVLFCVFPVLLLPNVALAFINNNRSEYIIDVTPACPSSPEEGVAVFTLLADVPAYAQATCRGNHTYDFNGVGDGITFLLSVGFEVSLEHQQCVFQKKVGTHTYTVLLEVGWGEPDGFILTHKEQYQVSCAYGKKATGTTKDQPVKDWLIAPEEKQFMIGDFTNSSFELRVIDVRGDPFFSSLPFGRWIQLEALSDGIGGELGIRVLSCVAKNEISSYAILRAGCGDGIVFAKDAGFQTRGRRVFSPYFEGFRLKGSKQLKFVCNFTLCESNCDGNSCPVEKKRSVGNHRTIVEVEGPKTDVSNEPELELVFLSQGLITPPPRPIISVGQTHLVEDPIKPLSADPVRHRPMISWVTALLISAIVLLVFSTTLQVCIYCRTPSAPTKKPEPITTIQIPTEQKSTP